MYWLHTDETNADRRQGQFFIYGGLVATEEQMVTAHHAVSTIREKYGYAPSDTFKFDTNSRPSHVSRENCTAAKADAIAAAHSIGLKMIVTVVHHAIAKNTDDDARAVWALQNLSHHFGTNFLERHNSFGAICIDRLPERFSYREIERMFRGEVQWPDGHKRAIPRVIHYSITSLGASHMNSLVDICLGTFRFCANAVFDNSHTKEIRAIEMFPPLAKLLWSDASTGGAGRFIGYGLRNYPVQVKVDSYRVDYIHLFDSLECYRIGKAKPTRIV